MLRIGKVKESVLKRSVLRQLKRTEKKDKTPDIFLQINPVEGWTLAAPRAVYGVVNALVAAGATWATATDSVQMAITILMPEGTEEAQLKSLMKDLNTLCQKENILLTAGHTAVSPAVKTLVMSVAGIGKSVRERAVGLNIASGPNAAKDMKTTSGIKKEGSPVDMDIIMVGHAGREGAALLAIEQENSLRSRYAQFFIDEAKALYNDAGLKKAADILWESGTVRMQDVREGGVFGALWELSSMCGVGLDIDLKKIPIRQHTIEVCEFLDLNPYMLLSGGCILAICPDGRQAVEKLRDEDICAEIIGRTTKNNDRLIRYDTEVRYLEPSKMDEIYKYRRY
jgi:hydrogenase maturation factor